MLLRHGACRCQLQQIDGTWRQQLFFLDSKTRLCTCFPYGHYGHGSTSASLQVVFNIASICEHPPNLFLTVSLESETMHDRHGCVLDGLGKATKKMPNIEVKETTNENAHTCGPQSTNLMAAVRVLRQANLSPYSWNAQSRDWIDSDSWKRATES